MVPGPGDGRAWSRPPGRAVCDRPTRHLAGAQRGQGPHRGVRLPGADRRGQGRARRGAVARRCRRAQPRRPAGRDDGDPHAGPRLDLRSERRCRGAHGRRTGRRPGPGLLRPHPPGEDRARRPPPPRRAPGGQRCRQHGGRTGGRPHPRAGRREPARARPSLSHADGAARARRRARRHQRRLQRQPGLDAVRAGDPRAHRPFRQADGRRTGGDARARRHRRGGAPAGRAAPRAARHRRGRGRRVGRPRGVRRTRRRRAGHDALRRDRHRGRGVVARECGRSRRRTRQGVAFGAARDGGRHARRRPGG